MKTLTPPDWFIYSGMVLTGLPVIGMLALMVLGA